MDRLLAVPRLLAVLVVVALLVALTAVFWPGQDKRFVTAYFDRAVSLYEGSDVKVLGLPVGQVERVEPQGTRVRVQMWVDETVEVPADAKAVIISPAVVGDRFVQLAPAYTGGPVMRDGAVIGQGRTASPVELDRIYQTMSDLTEALGPRGANEDGALSRLLDVSARNLDGQGAQFHRTIKDLGRFSGTLDNNKEELFASMEQLARFTAALKRSDSDIRAFNRQMALMSGHLAGERQDLAKAMSSLSVALREVSRFVQDNRQLVKSNVDSMARISQVLVKQREALAESLDVAPLALNNLMLAYNPTTGALDQRTNVSANEHQLQHDPALFLCALANQTDDSGRACDAIRDAVSAGRQLQRGRPFGPQSDAEPASAHVELVDPTLAGVAQEGGKR